MSPDTTESRASLTLIRASFDSELGHVVKIEVYLANGVTETT